MHGRKVQMYAAFVIQVVLCGLNPQEELEEMGGFWQSLQNDTKVTQTNTILHN